MNTEKVFEILRKQGLSFLLLGIAVFYFYTENGRLNERIDKLSDDNKAINAAYQVDHQQMRQVIERNTSVIEKNTSVFEFLMRSKKNGD